MQTAMALRESDGTLAVMVSPVWKR
jgi:hypothetical protein